MSRVLDKFSVFDDFFAVNASVSSRLKFNHVNRIFFMAHFSRSKSLDAFDDALLRFAKANGYFTVLCTNQTQMSNACVDFVLQKPRNGRDALALKTLSCLIPEIAQDETLSVWFSNNSIAWDTKNLDNILQQFSEMAVNQFVFPSTSNYPKRHVQPYFFHIVLDQNGVDRFRKSFEWIKGWRLKRSVVHFYEYRLLEYLEIAGWKVHVRFDTTNYTPNRLDNSRSRSQYSREVNPTRDYWQVLPFYQVPILKKTMIAHVLRGFNRAELSNQMLGFSSPFQEKVEQFIDQLKK